MISEAGAFVQMLQLSRNLPPITPVLSWNELTAAQDEVRKVVVTQETYEALAVLRGALAERQIRPSDRRYDEAVDIIQANAWLAGRPSTSIPDIYPLQHVLWSREEDIIPVAKEVLQLADPLERECLELLQQAQELAAEFDAVRASKDKRRQFDGAIDLNKNLSKAYVVLEGLQQRAGDVRPGSTLAAAETQLNDLHTEVRKVLMTDQAIKRLMKGQQSA
jgi:MoxR-like ATPase